MKSSIRLKAYAKVNLILSVISKRSDGYHNIESIMQSISLHDLIELEKIESDIAILCDHPLVPVGKQNMAVVAAEKFFNTASITSGVRIKIKKNIPVQSGLGGGSSDAAAVLVGLDHLYGVNLSYAELKDLAVSVGSDAPFFLTGGTAIVRGRGEKVEKLTPLQKMWFVIVKPEINVSTAWAYEAYDKLNIRTEPQPGRIVDLLSREYIFNSLEEAVVLNYPQIKEIKERLKKLGALSAGMTGSGSAVFGIVESKDEAENTFKILKDDYSQVFVVSSLDRGVEIVF